MKKYIKEINRFQSDRKKETLLSERQVKDAIFNDVLVLQRYTNYNEFCKQYTKKRKSYRLCGRF